MDTLLGYVASYNPSAAIRFCFTLNSEVEISGGDGTIDNPYILQYPIPDISQKLKAGDYVYYDDATGVRRTCMVLYDEIYNAVSGTDYGVQIITMDTIENVNIGKDASGCGDTDCASCLAAAKTSHNNSISTLNARAEAYRNTNLSVSARVVGTIPDNPESQSGYYSNSSSFLATYGWNGQFRGGDTNYYIDRYQLNVLGIFDIGKAYWIGSRWNNIPDSTFAFGTSSVQSGGAIYQYYSIVLIGANTGTSNYQFGLRPVFRLKSDFTILSGDGSSQNPYVLQ